MQLQYAQRAAEKGSTGLFLKLQVAHDTHGNELIIAIVASSKRSESVYRIHDGIMAKMSGLHGDARLLAHHLLATASRFNWNEGASSGVSVKQVANACAEVQHSLTMRPGARPLAVDAVLFGLDGLVEGKGRLGLYKCHLTGVVDECHFCVVGDLCLDKMLYSDCVNELELLWNESQMRQGDGDVDGEGMGNGSVSRAITRMATVLLKQRQTTQSTTSSDDKQHEQKEHESPAVDIYIMKPNPKCRGGVQISCATCVRKEDLDHVGALFEEEIFQ